MIMGTIKSIVITPETHWDREWYLPFQSYRAKLVLLIDRLLDLIKTTNYPNFTLDGQTVVLQDYLEIRPEKEEEIKKYVKAGNISVGPMYILPDEYLVSGEALIRNLMLGIRISKKFGKYMNAAYIPDPFGHIAQLPQIVAGFELPIILFARGFGNEFKDLGLNMEFIWDAPGQAGSAIGVHLLEGYGSVANLSDMREKNGQYQTALKRIEGVVEKLAVASITDTIILNNGSDHLFAQPHLPEIIKQWNETHEAKLIQTDFGAYAEKIIPFTSQMKHYTGELHGGKYQYLLSGVYSARLWIKQENYRIQNLLERYTEPIAVLNWLLTKKKFPFPQGFIWGAWQELLRNHPHDSICGCSIDEVHDIDMKARFFNAFGMANEAIKESLYQLSSMIKIDENDGERIGFIVFNPLPWNRTDLIKVKLIMAEGNDAFNESLLEELTIKDGEGNEYPVEIAPYQTPPSLNLQGTKFYEAKFIGKDIPALGYKVYYAYPGEEPNRDDLENEIACGENWIENDYYKVTINSNGTFNLFDKEANFVYENLGVIEDGGDWGDEYDYSGPKETQKDVIITSQDAEARISTRCGPAISVAQISFSMNTPRALVPTPERTTRSDEMENNLFEITLELHNHQKIVHYSIKWNNTSEDHRTRILFPTGIAAAQVEADGHFYVIPRTITPPDDHDWSQKYVPTHHQNKFVTVSNQDQGFTVLNKGLPEYEAIKSEEGFITFAITLLRSIEWLSRGDFATRRTNAGPALFTPGAQCKGVHQCELGLTTGKGRWLHTNTYRITEEYHAPIQTAVSYSIGGESRIMDAIPLVMGKLDKCVHYDSEPILPEIFSLISMNNSQITMTACKKSELSDALIIRFLNLSNEPQQDLIKLGLPIEKVDIVNYNEEKPKNPIKAEARLEGDRVFIKLNAHVLATFALSLKN
jgi:mannosylglycerate hydrolase